MKKHLSVLLSLALALALAMGMAIFAAAEEQSVVYGDANGDGIVNMKDVLSARKYIAELPVEIDLTAADTNGDDTVNMKDVLVMRKFVAGLISSIDGGKGAATATAAGTVTTATETTATETTATETTATETATETIASTMPTAAWIIGMNTLTMLTETNYANNITILTALWIIGTSTSIKNNSPQHTPQQPRHLSGLFFWGVVQPGKEKPLPKNREG